MASEVVNTRSSWLSRDEKKTTLNSHVVQFAKKQPSTSV